MLSKRILIRRNEFPFFGISYMYEYSEILCGFNLARGYLIKDYALRILLMCSMNVPSWLII
jgi:hypothetical protein